MKKIVLFRIVFVAALCLMLAFSACEKDRQNDSADSKQSETMDMAEQLTDTSSELENDDEVEKSTEKNEITTKIETDTAEETTEETVTYEQLTDGPGVSMPEVEV